MTSWRDNVAQIEIEKRRWSILTHLNLSTPHRSLSRDMLKMGCRANGIPTTADQLEDALSWLDERGYVTLESLGPLETASLTADGREVAQGVRIVKGVLPFGTEA